MTTSAETHRTKRNGGRTRIQEANRSKILEAALGEFSRLGYAGATLDRIAEGAGMSKSNLLYYYGSKKAVYEAVLDNILRAWIGPLRHLEPDGDPAEELTNYIIQKMKISSEYPEASRLFAIEIMQGAQRVAAILQRDLKPLVDEKCKVIQAWVDAGKLRRVDPIHLIFTIWAATQHYADFDTQIHILTGAGLEQEHFRERAVASVVDMILHGALA